MLINPQAVVEKLAIDNFKSEDAWRTFKAIQEQQAFIDALKGTAKRIATKSYLIGLVVGAGLMALACYCQYRQLEEERRQDNANRRVFDGE